MNFKALLNKEFLFESDDKEGKKTNKKHLSIFYKFDINIKKLAEETGDSQNIQPPAPADTTAAGQSAAPAPEQNPEPVPQEQPAPSLQPQDLPPAEPSIDHNAFAPVEQEQNIPPAEPNIDHNAFSSVVTEDDDKDRVEINDDSNIVRKFEGSVVLDDEQVDRIQIIDDIINTLQDVKQDGAQVLDDFTANILQTLLTPNAQQISQQIDKESAIFADIVYGYSKDEDNVGVRFIKRKNSDSISNSMIVDGDVVAVKFNLDTVNNRVVEFRNDYLHPETK